MHVVMCPSSQNDRNNFKWTGLRSIVIGQQRIGCIGGQLFFQTSQNSISWGQMGRNGAGKSQEKLWTQNTRRRRSNMVVDTLWSGAASPHMVLVDYPISMESWIASNMLTSSPLTSLAPSPTITWTITASIFNKMVIQGTAQVTQRVFLNSKILI